MLWFYIHYTSNEKKKHHISIAWNHLHIQNCVLGFPKKNPGYEHDQYKFIKKKIIQTISNWAFWVFSVFAAISVENCANPIPPMIKRRLLANFPSASEGFGFQESSSPWRGEEALLFHHANFIIGRGLRPQGLLTDGPTFVLNSLGEI